MSPCTKINKGLVPIKLVMFGLFGAYACASPFMTIHMKALGLTVENIAIIYTLLPLTQFLSTPIAGFISDRLGKYRNVLLLSLVMTIVFSFALLYVPPITESSEIYIKSTTEVMLRCAKDGSSIYVRDCNIEEDTSENPVNLNLCENFNCVEEFDDDGALSILLTLKEQSGVDSCDYKPLLPPSSYYVSVPTCSSQVGNDSSKCSIKCLIDRTRLSLEMPQNYYQLTFGLYSFYRILYNIFSSISFTLVNASALALTETTDNTGEYGRQRLWAMLSMSIFSPLSGILVDLISTDSSVNYAPAFHMHNALAFLTCIAVWFLDFEMEDAPPSYRETFKSFWEIIKSPPTLFLHVVVFWLGTVWGFLESFLFWFMIELKSPTYLMGLTITIGSIVGIPFLYYAKYIVTKFGHANILSFALLMYMVRCIGCSYLSDPWWIMPFEMLEIFTFHLMWVAAATYAVQLSPSGLLATIQGVIEGIHFGVGQGSGSLLGGSLISVWGNRKGLRIIGSISGILAVIYAVLHFFWLRKIKINLQSRKASIKSYGSSKTGRKTSSLSNPDVNGSNVPASSQVTITSSSDAKGPHSVSPVKLTLSSLLEVDMSNSASSTQ